MLAGFCLIHSDTETKCDHWMVINNDLVAFIQNYKSKFPEPETRDFLTINR